MSRRTKWVGCIPAVAYHEAAPSIMGFLTKEARVTCPFPLSTEEVVKRLFSEECRRVVCEAMSYLNNPYGTRPDYPVAKGVTWEPICSWDSVRMAAPAVGQANPDDEITAWAERVKAVITKWAIVQHVVEWLTFKATPGAIRFYFPGMRALMPSLVLPERIGPYRTPPGIAAEVPLIRRAVTAVAAAALLPNVPARTTDQAFTFQPFTVNVDAVNITTPRYCHIL